VKTQLQAWIDTDVKEKAKLLRINMSAVAERAIRKEIERLEKETSDVSQR
jgi:post-segregation antitoxin (ccd killing protein)